MPPYRVHFSSNIIRTLVTHDPQELAGWISEIEGRNARLIVGLDVETRPSFNTYQNPAATIQLCVDRHCVIFQILQYGAVFNTGGIPFVLGQFLANQSYTFVGVGIRGDVEKLEGDYGVHVGGQIVDLGRLAAGAYRNNQLKNASLKELASVILGMDVEEPRRVTLGPWDNPCLTHEQIKYACIDAFVSYEIGNTLSDYI